MFLSSLLIVAPLVASAPSPLLGSGSACDSAPLVQRIGGGTSGTQGLPEIRLEGQPVVGGSVALSIVNGPPHATGRIALSVNEGAQDLSPYGATFHPLPPRRVFSFMLDAHGTSGTVWELDDIAPEDCGLTFVAQAAIADPGAQGGFAFTGATRVRVGSSLDRSGPLFSPEQYLVRGYTDGVATADIDGDGHADLVSQAFDFGQSEAKLVTLLGAGDGTFEEGGRVTVPAGAGETTKVADLNGDGNPDVVLGGEYVTGVTAFLGVGDGTFVQSDLLSVDVGAGGFSVGDMDEDGLPDVVAIGYGPQGSSAVVFVGLGDGTFAAPVYTAIPDYSESLGLGDLDGDGHLDVAYSPYGRNELAVLTGGGDGTLTGPQYSPACGEAERAIEVLDLDSDGDLDLAFGSTAGDAVVALNGGGGAFPQGHCYDLPTSGYSVAAGDLDGDSVPDLAASFIDGFMVLHGVGDGTFDYVLAPESVVTAGERPESLAVGDWNEDGALDVATSTQLQRDLTILLGDGAGGFLGRARSVIPGSSARSLLAVDLDRDGFSDYAVVDFVRDSVTVLLRGADGDGVLAEYAVGEEPVEAVAADFDGDGYPDLASADSASDRVSVLLGLGDGTFAPALPLDVGAAPTSLCAGDWNADGNPDLAVTTTSVDVVVLLFGQGDGTFAALVPLPLPGLGPHRVTTADFDGDSAADLAVQGASDAVHVLLGDGTGAFAISGSAVCIGALAGHAAGDFDGDGVVDLVLTRIKREQALVFRGDGDGTFTFQGQVPVGMRAREIDVGDVDGDGKPDVVLSTPSSANVSVLINADVGFFEETRFFKTESPADVAITDADLDGLPDVAVLSNGGIFWNAETLVIALENLMLGSRP